MENGLRHILGYQNRMQGQAAAAQQQLFNDQNIHPELEHKVTRATDKFSENLHVIANEPSLAFFRIQEHVRKTLPQLVERKHEVQDLNEQVNGACFDAEYAIQSVRNMQKSEAHFKSVQDLLKNAMFLKQQITYEQSRKEQEKNRPSMYRGGPGGSSMLRTQTVDIPAGYIAEAQASGSSSSTHRPSPDRHGSPRIRSSSLSAPHPPDKTQQPPAPPPSPAVAPK